MSQTIKCCPVCGASAPQTITTESGGDWHCHLCDHVIDTSILAKEFLEADKELIATTFSEEEKVILIEYCPVCQLRSEKNIFENSISDHGGTWICENCDEYIEAYVLSDDHKERYVRDELKKQGDDEPRKSFIPFLLLALLLLIAANLFLR